MEILTNSDRLKDDMFKEDLRHINTNSDSEVLLNVLADSIGKATQDNVLTSDIIFDVSNVLFMEDVKVLLQLFL